MPPFWRRQSLMRRTTSYPDIFAPDQVFNALNFWSSRSCGSRWSTSSEAVRRTTCSLSSLLWTCSTNGGISDTCVSFRAESDTGVAKKNFYLDFGNTCNNFERFFDTGIQKDIGYRMIFIHLSLSSYISREMRCKTGEKEREKDK